MKKFICFLSLFKITYKVTYSVEKLTVNQIMGINLCPYDRLESEEITLWDKTDELYFIWQFPVKVRRSSFDTFHSIQLKFQYRIKDKCSGSDDQMNCLEVHDHRKVCLYSKTVDLSQEDFVEETINMENKESFLDAIDENNRYTLRFSIKAFFYETPQEFETKRIFIRVSNKTRTLSPTLLFY